MPPWLKAPILDVPRARGPSGFLHSYRILVIFVAACLSLLLLAELFSQLGRPDSNYDTPEVASETSPILDEVPLADEWNDSHKNETHPVISPDMTANLETSQTTTSTCSMTTVTLSAVPDPSASVIRSPQLWTTKAAKYGVLFGLKDQTSQISSPNGQFQLSLQHTGDLALEQKSVLGNAWKRVWSTNTGTAINSAAKGRNLVTLDNHGTAHVMVQVVGAPEDVLLEVWHSGLLAQCQGISMNAASAINDTVVTETEVLSALQLDNRGRLETRDFSGKTTCVLYAGPVEAREDKEQYGRLAIVVAGLMRRLVETCPTHMDKVIRQWPGTGVDVFVTTYWNSDDPVVHQEQEQAIRTCYGDYLRDVQIMYQADVEELFPSAQPAQCNPGKLDRLISQLKTVALGADLLQKYILRSGVVYNMVLRLRPDTNFVGNPPHFLKPSELGKGTIVSPMRHDEHYYYCHKFDGTLAVGEYTSK